MIEITKNIWIGNSDSEKWVGRHRPPMDCVLVVAHDMTPTNDWRHSLDYMHVGIVDGPGNPIAVYHAAVLALVSLLHRHEGGKVLVCCHGGGRALAVVVMYMYLNGMAPSWDECMETLRLKVKDLPAVHDVHRKAFFLMDWGMMTRVLEGEVSDEAGKDN